VTATDIVGFIDLSKINARKNMSRKLYCYFIIITGFRQKEKFRR
jgi:hypothetical protein